MTIETIKPFQISRRGLLRGALGFGAATALTGGAVPALARATQASLGVVGPIHRAISPSDMSLVEQEHVPLFLAPEMAIRGRTTSIAVQAGTRLHPMDEDHWIERLRLLDDAGHVLADLEFLPTGMTPGFEIYFRVDRTTTFVAQTFCNQHGIWEAEHKIAV